MLVLADRGFFSYALWRKAIGTGADLLWRVRTDAAGAKPQRTCETCETGPGWRTCAAPPTGAGGADAGPGHRLHASTTDGRTRPATGCSPRCWTPPRPPRPSWPRPTPSGGRSSSAFDELKTHQRGPRTVLRSKSPDLVLQEIWGHLCCHYAIRSLMADAAAARRATTPTGSASSPRCGSPGNPSPSGRFSP